MKLFEEKLIFSGTCLFENGKAPPKKTITFERESDWHPREKCSANVTKRVEGKNNKIRTGALPRLNQGQK